MVKFVEKMQKECTLPGSFADTAESSLFAARQYLIWLVMTELLASVPS